MNCVACLSWMDWISMKKSHFFIFRLSHTTDAIPILAKFTPFISSFEVKKSSLDDVFIAINGKVVNHDDGIR